MPFETRLTPEMIARHTASGWWGADTIYGLLSAQVAAYPEREAIVDAKRRITYAELKDGIDRTAADAVGFEHSRRAVDAVFEFAVTDATAGVDDRLALGMRGDACRQQSVKRVRAPPSAFGVARDHFGGETGLKRHACVIARQRICRVGFAHPAK